MSGETACRGRRGVVPVRRIQCTVRRASPPPRAPRPGTVPCRHLFVRTPPARSTPIPAPHRKAPACPTRHCSRLRPAVPPRTPCGGRRAPCRHPPPEPDRPVRAHPHPADRPPDRARRRRRAPPRPRVTSVGYGARRRSHSIGSPSRAGSGGPPGRAGSPTSDAGLAQEGAREAPALSGVGEHVREHAAEHEALGRVAQRVDQPVAPGAPSLDVADEREPARRHGVEPAREGHRVGVGGDPAGVIGALDGGQPDLVGPHAVVEQRGDGALRAGPLQQGQPG